MLPTNAGMSAAGRGCTPTPTTSPGCSGNDKKASAAYPLTMVIYAMVPTGGICKKKAQKIAQWLDFVANQRPGAGRRPGDLPPGYLPLTAECARRR